MELIERYGGLPEELLAFAGTKPMQRLLHVGMNCGCEYTACPLYKTAQPYSRYLHSLGAAAIVWHFTSNTAQSLSALFHDIATPVFAHVVDFLNGDHLRQESTEAPTHEILTGDAEIQALLTGLGLTTADVDDYHRYPIADNDSPRLSSDRLEYTLGNAYRTFGVPLDTVSAVYQNLTVAEAEDGAPELAFRDLAAAQVFSSWSLRQSYWFVSDDDRFFMQALADLLRFALQKGAFCYEDLWQTEPDVIAKLDRSPACREYWRMFRRITGTASGSTPPEGVYAVRIRAKKRHINPLVLTQTGPKRQRELDAAFAAQLQTFLEDDFNRFVRARFD